MAKQAPYPPKVKAALKEAYVEALREVGIIGAALSIAGFSRKSLRNWQAEDDEFMEDCQDAHQDAIDKAELVVRERGVDGWEEPVTYKGQPLYKRDPLTGDQLLDEDFMPIPLTVPRRNDELLKFFMSGNSAKYGTKKSQIEMSGPDGGPFHTERWVRFVDSDGDGRFDPLDEPTEEER